MQKIRKTVIMYNNVFKLWIQCVISSLKRSKCLNLCIGKNWSRSTNSPRTSFFVKSCTKNVKNLFGKSDQINRKLQIGSTVLHAFTKEILNGKFYV